MSIYLPTHQHQGPTSGDPTWRVDCSAFCLAMYADAVTLGGVKVDAKWVRLNSGESVPDPKSPGLNIPQLDVVAAKLHIALDDRQGHPWSDLVRAIQGGRRVLAQIDYASLGTARCQPNGDFGHMLLLHYFGSSTGSLRASDPLCSDSKVYSSATIRKAMERFARDSGLSQGVRFAVSRVVPQVQS